MFKIVGLIQGRLNFIKSLTLSVTRCFVNLMFDFKVNEK